MMLSILKLEWLKKCQMKLKFYFLCIAFFNCSVFFAMQRSDVKEETTPYLDEIDLEVLIPFEGNSYYIKALLGSSDVFLSFYEVINVLEIPIERKDGLLYVHDKRYKEPYLFDFPESRMILNEVESTMVANDFVVLREGEEYVRPEFFKMFGITIEYSKKDIDAVLTTENRSPKEVRLLREKNLKRSIKNKNSEILEFDSIYSNERALYRFNSIDYNIGFSNFSNKKKSAFLNANSRHILFGGGLNVGYRFQTGGEQGSLLDRLSFNWKNSYDNKFIKSLELGELGSIGIANLGSGGRSYGVRFSNKHGHTRRYKEQQIEGYITPNTPIELYAGRELIDYQYTDGNGFYSFNYTPTRSKTSIKLKYIDESGNLIEIKENLGLMAHQNDKQELTYESFFTTSGSNINSGLKVNYGITRNITTFVAIQNAINFTVNQTLTIPSAGVYTSFFENDLSINTMYQHGTSFNLNFRVSTNKFGNFRGEYSDFFAENTFSNFGNQGKEFLLAYQKRATLFEKVALLFNIQKEITKTDVFRSTTIAGLKIDFSRYRFSYSNRMNSISPEIGSASKSSQSQFGLDINASRRLKINLQYFDDFKNSASKQGVLNINYKRNSNFTMRLSASCRTSIKDLNASLSVRYDLTSFLAKSDVNYSRSGFSNNNSISGSYIVGNDGQSTLKSNIDTGGTGALLIPFLDKNNNGYKDSGEPMVKGLRVDLENGAQREILEDGSIYIHKMIADVVQKIELNQERVKNIYHRLEHKTIGVKPQSGLYSTVFLPFKEVGEIEGNVSFTNGTKRPLKVSIYDMSDKKMATAKIESDGYFSYLGLTPGKYYLKIEVKDSNTDHTITPFELLPNSKEGAYLGGLNVNFN